MAQETHEILFKTNYADIKKAEAEYKVFTSQKIADDKIRVDSAKTTNKVIVDDEKLTNKIALIDYQETLRKKREADNQYKKDSAKLTGQSVELGSKTHIQGLKRELSSMAPGTDKFIALNNQLKNLEANYRAAKGSGSIFNRGLLETGENLVTITAGFYLASTAVFSFGKATVQAFAEQEKSLTQLNAATGDNIALRDRLIGKSSDIQNTFGIPDETIQSLQAFLLLQGRSEEQIGKTIEAARLLAIVQGTDIRDALMKVDQTFEGQIGRLGKLGSEFKNLSTDELENGAAVDIIISKYGKFGNIQDTTYTKTQKLSAAWSESKETIGSVIVDAIDPLIVGLSNLGLKGQDVVKVIGQAVLGFGTLGSALKLVKMAFSEFNAVITGAINSIGDIGGRIPLIGGAFESLSGYALQYQSILTSIARLQYAIGLSDTNPDDAKGGTKYLGKTKELTANSGNLFTPKNGSPGNTGSQEKQVELTFLEAYRKKIADLEKDIAALTLQQGESNIKEYEKLTITDELIKKQKELNELKRVNVGLEGYTRSGVFPSMPDLRIGRNAIGGEGGTATDANKLLREQEEKNRVILGYTNDMWTNFQSMMEATGLMGTDFQKIVSMINSLIGFGNSAFGFLDGLLGFIGMVAAPFTGGASVPIAAGIGGLAGGMNANPRVGGGGMSGFNGTVVVNSEVEKTKSVKFYGNTLPEYNRRQAVKTL